MKKRIVLSDKVCISDFKKVIAFISEDIKEIHVSGRNMEIDFKDGCDTERLLDEIKLLSEKYVEIENGEKPWYENQGRGNYADGDILYNEELFHKFGPGMYGLNGAAQVLYDFFEELFERIGEKLGGIQKVYPTLLPVEQYVKTGYLKKSPQYAIFCCNVHENLSELLDLQNTVVKGDVTSRFKMPEYALSPSACFHTYIEYENCTLPRNKIVSFTQNVFRNEGRLNYDELGRLRDYHVKEIVFFGDAEFVDATRHKVMEETKQIIIKLNLCGRIEKAYDPFIIPKFQKYKKIQMIDMSKYELQLNVSQESSISVASFNLHGSAFTYPFKIKIKNCENPVTGCVGFGLERWVMAFLCQYGCDVREWPEDIQKYYERVKNGQK